MNRKDNKDTIFIAGRGDYIIRLYKSKANNENGSFFNHLLYL